MWTAARLAFQEMPSEAITQLDNDKYCQEVPSPDEMVIRMRCFDATAGGTPLRRLSEPLQQHTRRGLSSTCQHLSFLEEPESSPAKHLRTSSLIDDLEELLTERDKGSANTNNWEKMLVELEQLVDAVYASLPSSRLVGRDSPLAFRRAAGPLRAFETCLCVQLALLRSLPPAAPSEDCAPSPVATYADRARGLIQRLPRFRSDQHNIVKQRCLARLEEALVAHH